MPKKSNNLNLKPIPRGFYAFNVERAGDFLIYVEMTSNCYKFIYVPGAELFFLSLDDFTNSINNGILTFVEQLPEDVYQESLMLSCPAQ